MTSSELPLSATGVGDVAVDRPHKMRRALLGGTRGRVGVAVLGVIVFGAIFAPWISGPSPTEQMSELALQGPSWGHPFGGDDLGRDVFSRTLYGGRVSLGVGLMVVVAASVIGAIAGAVAGMLGGWVDTVIMRVVDFQLSFPFIVLAFILLAILGPGLSSVVVSLTAALWVNYARVIRAETLRLRSSGFVSAAITMGSSRARILRTHILPNVLPSILVLATLDIGFVIIFEASLTYLGLGIQPPTPTWGGMLDSGQSLIEQASWMVLFPGAVLVLTVLAVNLIGDQLVASLDSGE